MKTHFLALTALAGALTFPSGGFAQWASTGSTEPGGNRVTLTGDDSGGIYVDGGSPFYTGGGYPFYRRGGGDRYGDTAYAYGEGEEENGGGYADEDEESGNGGDGAYSDTGGGSSGGGDGSWGDEPWTKDYAQVCEERESRRGGMSAEEMDSVTAEALDRIESDGSIAAPVRTSQAPDDVDMRTNYDGGPEEPAADVNSPEMRQRALALVNDIRAAAGVGPLTLDDGMSDEAADWSQRMADEGFFEHSNLPYAENIAMTGSGSDVSAAIRTWEDSPGHYSNMIGERHTRMGIGSDNRGDSWTQVFD